MVKKSIKKDETEIVLVKLRRDVIRRLKKLKAEIREEEGGDQITYNMVIKRLLKARGKWDIDDDKMDS